MSNDLYKDVILHGVNKNGQTATLSFDLPTDANDADAINVAEGFCLIHELELVRLLRKDGEFSYRDIALIKGEQ